MGGILIPTPDYGDKGLPDADQTIVDDPLRMQVGKKELKLFHDDFAIMTLKRKFIADVLAVLGHGALFHERLVLESQKKPLTPEIEAVKKDIPSFKDLVKKHAAEVKHKDSEHRLMFLPWTADDGSTQFMVEMAHFPQKGKPKRAASLTQWQIPIVSRMLQKVLSGEETKHS